ncbi:hypothetical protein T484DRAFT_1796333 [Baffinella frigidus]|nr:hypothetical protein T484DRAFT_1796333 [Cryptophyta sp. CCMP2293]
MEGEGVAAEAAEQGEAQAPVEFQCAVCFEELGVEEIAKMPCCFREASTTNLCMSCVQVICEQGIDGRLGKCPKCGSWVSMAAGGVISAGAIAGTCTMQAKELADPARRLCDMCVIGRTVALRYECQRTEPGRLA